MQFITIALLPYKLRVTTVYPFGYYILFNAHHRLLLVIFVLLSFLLVNLNLNLSLDRGLDLSSDLQL